MGLGCIRNTARSIGRVWKYYKQSANAAIKSAHWTHTWVSDGEAIGIRERLPRQIRRAAPPPEKIAPQAAAAAAAQGVRARAFRASALRMGMGEYEIQAPRGGDETRPLERGVDGGRRHGGEVVREGGRGRCESSAS
ncbi:hypothetical protein GUJ93_ZPchr0011g27870 [Zizania palustris]|uniref:Uncharacterized protein n=1 Tax=Zizania palustris TaxID=103762 RepID=A0A8J5WKC4_ZIZPA|nr:hypothetical protein GUJ93_ZPchr0011g27870 [Zizania palustris]